MKEVTVGIVGLGWGKKHVLAISNLEGIRVAAVADNAPLVPGEKKPIAEYAASIGAAGYADGVKMIEEAEIDAVDVAVRPKWREPLLRAAAKRGVPVLVEKPMANNLAQAELFARIAEEAGIPFMMEYPLRFHPAMQRAKELLAGPLGKPLSVTAELQTQWNPPKGHWSWDEDVEAGWFTECGCHILDTVCFLAGKPTAVFALGRSFKGNGKGIDSAALAIEFEGGSHAVVNGGGIATQAFNVPMYVKVYAENGEMLISGGNWVYDKVTWALHGTKEQAKEENLPGPPRMELLRQNLIEFARLVRGEIKSPCTAEDGLVVQRIMAAMAKSIASGNSVRL
ncbi:MAG: Gfo/Idh/MocA family oxidoreductase [Candidatus Sumerlaeota bacterium]|nr:Gfo/Idh/MocA family oxidoreductase [Candidatus Sumerlaeota bacterium]